MRKALNLIILASAFSWNISASANDGMGDIDVGMGYGQVLALSGAPVDKEVRESKREDLWRYNKFHVLFNDGKVKEITELDSTPVPGTTGLTKETKQAPRAAATTPTAQDKPEIDRESAAEEADNILKDLAEGTG